MNGPIDWLMNLQRFGMKPGLDTMRLLLDRLGNPERGIRLVLVGGTNGKGSCASSLASMLTAAGIRTGLFTSPHLTRVMERFVVAGRELEPERLERALDVIRPVSEELGATFFEVMVACAWLLFRGNGCEAAVFEVGLGGRFDATNAAEPELSVITNVELDHMEVLGGTREAIAADKAWLMRPGRPAVTAASEPALSVLDGHAEARGANLVALGRDFRVRSVASGWDGNRVQVGMDNWQIDLATPLIGRHQADNVAVAAVAARLLGLEDDAIRDGAAAVRWPGRLEGIRFGQRNWLLDGAHNPAGALALKDALQRLEARPRLLMLGLSGDKDAAGVVTELSGLADIVVATASSLSPRSMPVNDLLRLLPKGAESAANPAAAISRALELSGPDDLVVVAGSLYLIGEVRPLLTGQESEPFERWQ